MDLSVRWFFYATHGLTKGGASAVVLVLCLALASKSMVLPVPRGLTILGDISYSLYLLHPLVQKGTERLFHFYGHEAYATGFSFLFLTTALSIITALLSFTVLERGLGGMFLEFLSRRKR